MLLPEDDAMDEGLTDGFSPEAEGDLGLRARAMSGGSCGRPETTRQHTTWYVSSITDSLAEPGGEEQWITFPMSARYATERALSFGPLPRRKTPDGPGVRHASARGRSDTTGGH